MTTATAEVIDPETGEVMPRPTALARVIPTGGSRLLALDAMDESEFSARLSVLSVGQARMKRIQRELLGEGDFGIIPGTKKPTLLKPGAEKLLKFYGLVSTFVTVRTLGDGVTAPALHVQSACRVHVGDADGPVVAEGEGTCNTWERKYRYRRDGSENPDPLDLDNTIVKMARKRALVDATLLATATSGLFTQDLEDMEPEPASLPPEQRASRMVAALGECDSLAAFDALTAEMKAAAAELPEAARAHLRTQAAAIRAALLRSASLDAQARDAMAREPDPAPAREPGDDAEPPADVKLPDMGKGGK
jgi:hypothetical protein